MNGRYATHAIVRRRLRRQRGLPRQFCARLRFRQVLVAATASRGTLVLRVGRIASRAILSRRRRVALMGAAYVRSQSVLELDTSWTQHTHFIFRQYKPLYLPNIKHSRQLLLNVLEIYFELDLHIVEEQKKRQKQGSGVELLQRGRLVCHGLGRAFEVAGEFKPRHPSLVLGVEARLEGGALRLDERAQRRDDEYEALLTQSRHLEAESLT